MRIILIAVAAIVCFVLAAWMIVVPIDQIEAQAGRALKNSEFNLQIDELKKGLLFSVKANRVDISKDEDMVMSIQSPVASLSIIESITSMSGVFELTGSIGGGAISGKIAASKSEINGTLKITGAQISELGLFEFTGIEGSGLLGAEVVVKDGRAEVKFNIKQIELQPTTISGQTLPLDMFKTARGVLSASGGQVEIKSLTLEGGGSFARASGKIKGGKTDLIVELMPNPDVLPDSVLSMLLSSKYKVTDGHYRIPIKRKL